MGDRPSQGQQVDHGLAFCRFVFSDSRGHRVGRDTGPRIHYQLGRPQPVAIDGLWSPLRQRGPATLTWSFVPDGTDTTRLSGIGTNDSNLIAFMNSNFGGTPAQQDLTKQPWFHIFDESFGRWEQLGGVNYVYEPHDDGVMHPGANGVLGVRGDIRISGIAMDGVNGTLAFTWLPTAGSDMAFDTGEASFFSISANNYLNLRDTIMHEIGHGFGMQHVISSSDLLMEPEINTDFDGPQLDEVRGVQYFFGDVNEKSNGGMGNGTSALATSLGIIASGATTSIGAAANVPGQAISARRDRFCEHRQSGRHGFLFLLRIADLATERGPHAARRCILPGRRRSNSNLVQRQRPQQPGPHHLFHERQHHPRDSRREPNRRRRNDQQSTVVGGRARTMRNITGADNTIQLYELSLSVVAQTTGDYNHDGFVDAADYTLWRNTLGQSVPAGSGADGSGPGGVPDGIVNRFDFDFWKSHYGEAAGAGAATNSAPVPEPASFLLCASCCPGAFAYSPTRGSLSCSVPSAFFVAISAQKDYNPAGKDSAPAGIAPFATVRSEHDSRRRGSHVENAVFIAVGRCNRFCHLQPIGSSEYLQLEQFGRWPLGHCGELDADGRPPGSERHGAVHLRHGLHSQRIDWHERAGRDANRVG